MFFLLGLLVLGMSACSVFARPRSPTQELPSLQGIFPFEHPYQVPEFVTVVPGGYAYFATVYGAIIVLDGTELVTVIPLPPGESSAGYYQGPAIHPQTNVGYLANGHTDNLYVIQGTEIITILRNIGDGPHAVGVNSNSGLVYVGHSFDPLGVTVLEGTEIITRLATSFVEVITPDPNNSKVYVGQAITRNSPRKEQGLLAIVDATTLLTLTNLNYEQDIPDYLGGEINNIAVDRNSGEVYMIRNLGTVVYMHDGQVKSIKLGAMGYTGLHDIAIDPHRGLAYVSSWGDPYSHVVVLQQGEFLTALRVGKDPRAVVYDETHDYVYVANRLGHSFSVIRNTEVISTIQARGNPWDIDVDEERGYIYFANPDSHNITVFGFEEELRSFWDFLPFVSR
jgi:DNA-binding beta-propeller fold protein YncE